MRYRNVLAVVECERTEGVLRTLEPPAATEGTAII
jgi:hypothetical protein